MLASPKVGALVQCWYAAKTRPARPLHGLTGVIVIASRGRPRNHGVLIAGTMYVVPCGNLRPLPTEVADAL